MLGYFGQRNFGDELTNLAVARLAAHAYPGRALRIINQATPSSSDVSDMMGVDGFSSVSSVWFDTARTMPPEALFVCNSGWVDCFCTDYAAACIDSGSKLYVLSLKNTVPQRRRLGHMIMREVLAEAEIVVCRSAGEAADFPGAITGIDMAELVSSPAECRFEKNELVYCPRWFENVADRELSRRWAEEAAGDGAVLLACNEHDLTLCPDGSRVVRAWQEPEACLRLLREARAVVSGGRFHPAYIAACAGVPVSIGHSIISEHGQKIALMCQELCVPRTGALSWDGCAVADMDEIGCRKSATMKALDDCGLLAPAVIES